MCLCEQECFRNSFAGTARSIFSSDAGTAALEAAAGVKLPKYKGGLRICAPVFCRICSRTPLVLCVCTAALAAAAGVRLMLSHETRVSEHPSDANVMSS